MTATAESSCRPPQTGEVEVAIYRDERDRPERHWLSEDTAAEFIDHVA